MQIDNDVKQLVEEGTYAAALKLLQDRRLQDPRQQRATFDVLLDDLSTLRRAGAPFSGLLALFVRQMLIIGLAVLGVTFVGLMLAERTFFPAADRLLDFVLPLVFAPGVLPLLALVSLVFGLPMARKFKSPALFVTGLIATSLGLLSIGLFPSAVTDGRVTGGIK